LTEKSTKVDIFATVYTQINAKVSQKHIIKKSCPCACHVGLGGEEEEEVYLHASLILTLAEAKWSASSPYFSE